MRATVLCLLAACGRIGFGAQGRSGDGGVGGDGTAGDGAQRDGGGPDSPLTSSITYVGPFAQRHPGVGGNTDAFTVQAAAAGDVIAMQAGCGFTTTAPTALTISAGGWVFEALDSPATSANLATVELVAIAPDTTSVTVNVTWTGSPCEIGTAVLADEFAGVYTAGGVTQVYSEGDGFAGTGTCQTTFNANGDAPTLWAACFSQTSATAVGPGLTAGANDGGGDLAGYRITTDPTGTPETASFANSGAFTIDVIQLRSR